MIYYPKQDASRVSAGSLNFHKYHRQRLKLFFLASSRAAHFSKYRTFNYPQKIHPSSSFTFRTSQPIYFLLKTN